jgi:hypothetical protein
MIELLIVFMELVLIAVGTLAWSTIKTIALVLAALTYGLGKVAQLAIDFIVRQVDRPIKDALDIPGLNNLRLDIPALSNEVCEISHG